MNNRMRKRITLSPSVNECSLRNALSCRVAPRQSSLRHPHHRRFFHECHSTEGDTD